MTNSIKELQQRVNAINEANGWNEGDPATFSADTNIMHLALIMTEVAEAIEEVRNGHSMTETYYNPDKPTKPEGVPSELADIVIRTLHIAERRGIDLEAIIEGKLAYNETRGYKHGGKVV